MSVADPENDAETEATVEQVYSVFESFPVRTRT